MQGMAGAIRRPGRGRTSILDWASVILGAFIGIAGVFAVSSVALYPLMRRSFLLWNFGRTLGYLVLAVTALPLAAPGSGAAQIYAVLNDIGVAFAAAMAGPFLASYLEPDARFDGARRRLRLAGLVGLVAAVATPLGVLTPAADLVHDVLLLAVVAMVVTALARTVRLGSRTARFQSLAWGPLIVIGTAELCYEIATGRGHPHWPQAVLVAVVIDFVVTVCGLVDSFMIIKRERDRARADMREATRASTLDPLTGIANRRGLAARFSHPDFARPAGIAVIDCDHFKRINDNHGHDVGDEVLVAVAQALQGDDIFVGRLGGEEFVALLYGERWRELADEARRRISVGVKLHCPQLGVRVTASAGVAPVQADDTLRTAIKRADRALYAAKHGGRDRSLLLTGHGEVEISPIPVG